MDDSLKKSEEISATKHQKMLSNIADVIVIIDENGINTYKSPNVEKLFGWKPEELVGKVAWENIHEDDLVAVQNFFGDIIKEPHKTDSIECRYKHKDGNYKWILFTGTNLKDDNDINGILGNYHDISDRKKAELAIHKSEVRFKSLFQNLTNSSSLYEVIVDENGIPVDYIFLEVNPAYEKNIGVKSADLVGKRLLKVFPGTEPVWLDLLKEVFLTGIPKQVENYSKEVNMYFELIAFKPQEGQIAMIGSDITNRKLNELEILNAKERAEESDRLKSAFLQNMSHEIRTPLNAICGFSSLLDEPELPYEKRKDFISIINNSSNQLLSIVNDILTISSLETNQVEILFGTFNVNKVIDELYEIFKYQLDNKDIKLIEKKFLPDDQCEINSDRVKVTQILSNLINNAIKFTQKGFVEFGYSLKGDNLEFFVKDSGIGIDQDLHRSIFHRFNQADNSISRAYGGSGLGLSISKGYTELLKGEIWLESEIGQGSTFFFTIPYNTVKEVDKEDVNQVENMKNIHTVLVAEDEEFNFLFIKELLLEKNINLIHAQNGEEAVEAYRENPDIDLILMDIKMPKLDGASATKQIREINQSVPIIAQTAYALKTEIERFKDVFDDYLTKPIKSKDLFNKIGKYLK